MKIRLIRSATVVFEYAGKKFIIDPCLSTKHTLPSYAGKSPNPTADLPCDPLQIISDIDFAIVSHMHTDHFDLEAQKLLPKDLPVVCQNEDTPKLESNDFQNILPITNQIIYEGIDIIRAKCQHGSGLVLQQMGIASGFVFKNKNEPTVYWAGDTVLCKDVEDVITNEKPSVIITHSCGAVWGDNVLILMDAAQTIAVCKAASASTIIATHMESFDHATISRADLRKCAEENSITSKQLLIPLNGETYIF